MLKEPEPQEPEESAEFAASRVTAALGLLERLSPRERAVYVLREVFGCGPERIASVLGCSETAARQLLAAVDRAGDGGGRPLPWPARITGADQVARALAAIVPPLAHVGVSLHTRTVAGRPAAVFRDRDGTDLRVLALDITDGLIRTIHWTTV